MPGGDGTGPFGQGAGTGRKRGRGRGCGLGQGLGRYGSFDAGEPGICVCPNCGLKALEKAGMACSAMNCPECGTRMKKE